MRSQVQRFGTVAAIILGMAAGTALAQPGGGGGGPGGGGPRMFGGPGGMMMGGGQMMEPGVSSEQLKKWAAKLNLTPDQQDAAKALFDGYFADHQARAEKMRDAMEAARDAFRESRDPSVFQEMGEKMRAFREQAQKAEKGFMDDVKSLLTPEQEPAWASVERAKRRESGMRRTPFGVSGERADLVAIVDKLELTEEARAAIAGTLDSYEQDLDREIVKRDELRQQAEGQGQQIFAMMRGDGGGDMAAMEKMIKENREAMVRVRDVNRRYARQIESMLPAEVAPAFAMEFKKASFPDIYRERYAARVIAAAEKMDLTEEQRNGIAAIREGYMRDTDSLNKQNEAAIEEMEANFSLQNMMGGGPGGFRNEKMQELRTQRENVENTAVKKVQDLLTPEQKAKLPERRGDGEGGQQDRRPRTREGDNNGQQQGQRPRRQRGEQPAPPPGGF